MLAAEKHCIITYRLPWNQQTHQIMTITNILRSLISSFRNNIDLSKSISAKMDTLSDSEPFDLPKDLQAASDKLREYRKKARELRRASQSYESNLYKEREAVFIEINKDNFDEKRAKIVFRKSEETKKMMKNLPNNKKKGTGGLTRILVPLPLEGTELKYGEITDGPTMEALILNRNIRHFSQAGDTPLATNEIIDEIGFGGTTEIAQRLLDGTADVDAITDDEVSRLFLQALQRASDTIQIEISQQDMLNRYKNWDEKTTTSPSGRHLGHFHALFRGFKTSTDDERDEILHKRKTIIELHWLILQIAIKHQHVYERWKTIVTQMIEKEVGNPKLFRLRVIHLYECDFNLLLGICFRLLQQHMEDNKLINTGCYGGRPNRRAIDPVLVDITQTEMSMITRRPLVRFNNDATACFDCILVHLATVNTQSFGMPKAIAAIIGDFYEYSKYHIKTGIGVSKTYYKHTRERGTFGSGQGSSGSMYIWGMIASRLADLFEQHGYGSTYSNPSSESERLKIAILCFVDDTNLTNNGAKFETIQDILKRTQHDAQLWNDLL